MKNVSPNRGRLVDDIRPFAALAALLLAVDQLTKFLTARFFSANAENGLIHPTTNSELMLGIDLGWDNQLVTIVSLAGTVAWAALVWSASRSQTTMVALTLFVPGAISNLIDRLLYGAVRDWIVLGQSTWNVADFGIVAGLCIGFVGLFKASVSPPTPIVTDIVREGR